MRLSFIRAIIYTTAISSALTGCTQMEHKSDLPDKKPLEVIESLVKPHKKWSISSGAGANKSDFKLVLGHSGHNLFTVDYNGNVDSFNQNTGAKNWQVSVKTNISAGPAIANGKIIMAGSNGKVIALEADNGKFAWSWGSTSEILATPRIANNIVYIHTMDGGLSALSLTDGRQLWRYSYNLPSLVLRRASTPAIYKDDIIAGFANGKVSLMRGDDGSIVWTQDIGSPKGRNDLQRMVDISADPLVKGDVVYVASYQGSLEALAAATGQIKWQRDISSFSGFAIDQKSLYVADTNGDVVAVDLNNGATFWLQSDLHGRRLTKPAVMGRYVVVGDEDGFIHWLDSNTGKLVGRFEFDKEGVEATPIVHNNIVYILGRSGKLAALEVN